MYMDKLYKACYTFMKIKEVDLALIIIKEIDLFKLSTSSIQNLIIQSAKYNPKMLKYLCEVIRYNSKFIDNCIKYNSMLAMNNKTEKIFYIDVVDGYNMSQMRQDIIDEYIRNHIVYIMSLTKNLDINKIILLKYYQLMNYKNDIPTYY